MVKKKATTDDVLVFTLTRPARKGGGDRYETIIEGQENPFVIYIPQVISRREGIVPNLMKMTLEFFNAKGKSVLTP